MILQALYQLAQSEHLMEDPDFEPKPLAWLVTVGADGALLGLHGTHTVPPAEEGKKKPRPRPASFLVPREPGRTSGDRAFFLFDKAEYALGLDPETDPGKRREPEKLAARFALFRQRAEDCLTATGDEGVRAVCRFLARVAAGEIAVSLPEGCAGNDLFGFVYAPDVDRLVTARPQVQEHWRSLRAQAEEGGAPPELCLVSGRLAPPAATVPLIKNVPGGSTSGVALVSFNSNAFESYGWAGNANAPISRAAAEACSTALNRLLHPAFPDPRQPGQTLPSRHLRLSADTAVCFWATTPAGDAFAGAILALLEANPESVRALYRSLWRGVAVEIEDPTAFYALTLSGSQGRLILRDWLTTSVHDAAVHLAEHFRDLAIVRNTPPPRDRPLAPALAFRVLLRSLAVRGDDKGVPAALAGQIVHAALTGVPYPLSLLPLALERARAEIGRTDWLDLERRDARAALIKAVLNRRRRLHPATAPYPEITEAMDPNNAQPGYLLGRLMALLERTQQLALDDVNASVVDRFFSAASATPRVVFLRLLKNFRHHVRKAKDDPRKAGSAVLVERQVDRIVHDLGERAGNFPPALSLAEQGLFILGYHHERHELFLDREERRRRRQAQDDEPQETLTETAGA